MNTASFIYTTTTKFTSMENSIVAQTVQKKQQEKLKEEFFMGNNSKGGTSGADVVFHIFMTLITGGVWLGILVVWLIIKAASQK